MLIFIAIRRQLHQHYLVESINHAFQDTFVAISIDHNLTNTTKLALGNSHLPVELFTVEWGHFVSLYAMVILQVTGKWMPAVSYPILLIKVTPIMTVIKIVKL